VTADHAERRRERTHVAVGGAVGAVLRAGVVTATLAAAPGGETAGVLAINVLGAAALGWLVGRARHDAGWARLLPSLGTGLLGALTTFSTLAEQLARQVVAGDVLAAVVLGVVSLAAGVLAALLGLRLGLRGGTREAPVERR
jgi:CrcB protein